MVVIRPVTEELIFVGALVNAYFKGWNSMLRDLASSPHPQWPAFSPQSFFAGSFYHLISLPSVILGSLLEAHENVRGTR